MSIRVSSRFLANFERSRRAGTENMDIDTYVVVCTLKEAWTSLRLDPHNMTTSNHKQTENEHYTSEAPMDSPEEHMSDYSRITTSREQNGSTEFGSVSLNHYDNDIRQNPKTAESHKATRSNHSKRLKGATLSNSLTDDFTQFMKDLELSCLNN